MRGKNGSKKKKKEIDYEKLAEVQMDNGFEGIVVAMWCHGSITTEEAIAQLAYYCKLQRHESLAVLRAYLGLKSKIGKQKRARAIMDLYSNGR